MPRQRLPNKKKRKMTPNPCHKDNIVALKRIEGQVRGIQKMIEEERYCVDILNQLSSVVQAVASVKRKIYKRHLEYCVNEALQMGSAEEKQQKINEILDLLHKHNGG